MEQFNNQYVKPSQKDYSLSFKLAVVGEVESGSTGNRQPCANMVSRDIERVNGILKQEIIVNIQTMRLLVKHAIAKKTT